MMARNTESTGSPEEGACGDAAQGQRLEIQRTPMVTSLPGRPFIPSDSAGVLLKFEYFSRSRKPTKYAHIECRRHETAGHDVPHAKD
jgi:hypothetical protein